MSSITIQYDLRERFGPVRDQGSRPTCLACAMSDAHAAVRESWAPLSCEYLFYNANRREGGPPSIGASVRHVRASAEQDGQPAEGAWPYLRTLPADLTTWKPPDDVGDVYRRSSKITGASFDTAWDLTAVGRPALVVMTISDAFYAPDPDGVVDSPEPGDSQRRHAVIRAAAGERGGSRVLLVRNSWGRGWGLEGYAWLAEQYLTPRVMLVVALEEAA